MTDKTSKIRLYVSLSELGFNYSLLYLNYSFFLFYDFYDKKKKGKNISKIDIERRGIRVYVSHRSFGPPGVSTAVSVPLKVLKGLLAGSFGQCLLG
jgi:hypothetical protein